MVEQGETTSYPQYPTSSVTLFEKEFLKWINTPEELIEEVKHILKGEEQKLILDKNGKPLRIEFVEDETARLVNDLGATKIIAILKKYINKVTFTADYSDDEIMLNSWIFARDFVCFMEENWENFGIEPSVHRNNIVTNAVIGMVFSAYKMSGMRKFYKDIMQVRAGMDIPLDSRPKILGIIPKPW